MTHFWYWNLRLINERGDNDSFRHFCSGQVVVLWQPMRVCVTRSSTKSYCWLQVRNKMGTVLVEKCPVTGLRCFGSGRDCCFIPLLHIRLSLLPSFIKYACIFLLFTSIRSPPLFCTFPRRQSLGCRSHRVQLFAIFHPLLFTIMIMSTHLNRMWFISEKYVQAIVPLPKSLK